MAAVAILAWRNQSRRAAVAGALLALSSLPCLVYVLWAAFLWSACSGLGCDGTQIAIDALANAPSAVGRLLTVAFFAGLAAVGLNILAAGVSLVGAMRTARPE